MNLEASQRKKALGEKNKESEHEIKKQKESEKKE